MQMTILMIFEMTNDQGRRGTKLSNIKNSAVHILLWNFILDILQRKS